MHIDSCRISRILVDSKSSINILYRSILDRIEDTPEIARAMICPQTQSNLYGFGMNETRPPDMIALPVYVDPYNVITKFYLIDVASPTMRYSGGHGSTWWKPSHSATTNSCGMIAHIYYIILYYISTFIM